MKLHFRTLGSGEPLLILHGLFGSSDNWQTLGRKYAENYTVYLIDQRNHGHSDWSNEFDYKLLSDDLHELIKAEGLNKVRILGHSMGGKTAMTFALDHQALIEKMIIADIAPKGYPPHHGPILAALNSVNLDVLKTRKDVEDVISAQIPDPGTKMFLLKNLYWKADGQLGWRINIPVLEEKMPHIIAAIPNKMVDVNTLFLRGDRSGYITDADLDAIHDQFPNSQVKTIHGAGHWLHAEKPEEFYDITIKFLQ